MCDGFGSDTPGEVRERHEARQEDGAKLRVVRNPAIERQGVKERIQGQRRTSANQIKMPADGGQRSHGNSCDSVCFSLVVVAVHLVWLAVHLVWRGFRNVWRRGM
jgi:hypothetical protein